MAGTVELTGSKSRAAEIDHSVFKYGRIPIYHVIQTMSEEEERLLRVELSGGSASDFHLPHVHLSAPDGYIHTSAISSLDVQEPIPEPKPEPRRSWIGFFKPKLAFNFRSLCFQRVSQ